MRRTLGTFAAGLLAMLAVAAPAHGAEQTRENYVTQVEPICQANREANEEIMAGAQKRINKDEFAPVGEQFIRASESFAGMVRRIVAVPAPAGDSHRIGRWLEMMRLLKSRLRNVGKLYKAGEDIKAAHESILAQRSGISANNISIVFHFRYCRFSRLA